MTQHHLRTISHPENELQITPRAIREGATPRHTRPPGLWWEQDQRPLRRTQRLSGSGAGVLRLPDHPRDQRVLVKPTVVPAGRGAGGNWYKHGTYLQRAGVQGDGRGVG